MRINNKGQVLPYYLMTMMVLLVCWAMLLNMGKLLKDRIVMQNAADNAALSVAVYRARTLNLLGKANELMGTVLACGAFPMLVPLPTYDIRYVGGSISNFPYPLSDVHCRGGFENSVDYAGVNRIRFTVRSLSNFQKALVWAYPVQSLAVAQSIGKRQELNASNEPSGADRVLLIPGHLAESLTEGLASPEGIFSSLSPERLLGVRRNSSRITYFKTRNMGATVSRHYHIVLPVKWTTEDVSWYVAGNKFHQQKIVALAVKGGSSGSNAGYPVFSSLLNVSWPSTMAVAAAATYNTKGSMIPETDGTCTGVPQWLMWTAAALELGQLHKMAQLAKDIKAIPLLGPPASLALSGYTIYCAGETAYYSTKALKDDQTPVWKYEQAEQGGWDAHLVPVGDGVIRH